MRTFLLAASFVVSACTGASHGHGAAGSATVDAGRDPHELGAHGDDAGVLDGGGQTHHVRDLETEPCDAQSWRELGTDLRACELAGEDLEGVSLRRVDLSEADLGGANLKSADLFNAKLVRAKLTATLLDGAKLAGADFTSADLTGASLLGADLASATFTAAVLDGVVSGPETTCPNGRGGPCW